MPGSSGAQPVLMLRGIIFRDVRVFVRGGLGLIKPCTTAKLSKHKSPQLCSLAPRVFILIFSSSVIELL